MNRYHPGTTPIPNPSLPVSLDTPHSITVRLSLSTGDEGVRVSQVRELVGWVLFVADDRAHGVPNVLEIEFTGTSASSRCAWTRHVRCEHSTGVEPDGT